MLEWSDLHIATLKLCYIHFNRENIYCKRYTVNYYHSDCFATKWVEFYGAPLVLYKRKKSYQMCKKRNTTLEYKFLSCIFLFSDHFYIKKKEDCNIMIRTTNVILILLLCIHEAMERRSGISSWLAFSCRSHLQNK